MKSKEYWEEAALLREIAVQEGATYTAKEVLKLYDEALKDIDKEIEKIKYNFRKRFGIDNETASYYLEQAQQEENLQMLIESLETAPNEKARKDILEYIRRDGLSVRAYSARKERYEAVKSSIYARVKKLATVESQMVKEMLKKAYKESYYGNIDDTAKGINAGINLALLNDDAIEAAVSAKWHGKRFSERIWKNTDRLASEAQKLVIKSIMSGESNNKTAAKLSEIFNVEKYNATTLIRTETAHIHAMADMKAYEDLEIEKYRYLATLDYVTCPICQNLDGMTFSVSEAKEGVNYPCMHPRCRCTTTVDMIWSKRSSRNPITGKSELIDGNITYNEWVNKMTLEEKQAFELAKRKNSNRTADKLQHEKYKKLLGTKEVPKSFDKFQNLKYNDIEKWNFLQLDYKRQNRLLKQPELILPNAKKATADDRKFSNYLFNPNNTSGYAKGKAFTSRLGYDESNYSELKEKILQKCSRYPSKYIYSDIYGDRYEQKIILYGQKGTPANVVIGWKVKDGKTWMTSAYIKEI